MSEHSKTMRDSMLIRFIQYHRDWVLFQVFGSAVRPGVHLHAALRAARRLAAPPERRPVAGGRRPRPRPTRRLRRRQSWRPVFTRRLNLIAFQSTDSLFLSTLSSPDTYVPPPLH